MDKIPMQDKLADWQRRMDARREKEEEEKRLEAEKERQKYLLQRTSRGAIRP